MVEYPNIPRKGALAESEASTTSSSRRSALGLDYKVSHYHSVPIMQEMKAS